MNLSPDKLQHVSNEFGSKTPVESQPKLERSSSLEFRDVFSDAQRKHVGEHARKETLDREDAEKPNSEREGISLIDQVWPKSRRAPAGTRLDGNPVPHNQSSSNLSKETSIAKRESSLLSKAQGSGNRESHSETLKLSKPRGHGEKAAHELENKSKKASRHRSKTTMVDRDRQGSKKTSNTRQTDASNLTAETKPHLEGQEQADDQVSVMIAELENANLSEANETGQPSQSRTKNPPVRPNSVSMLTAGTVQEQDATDGPEFVAQLPRQLGQTEQIGNERVDVQQPVKSDAVQNGHKTAGNRLGQANESDGSDAQIDASTTLTKRPDGEPSQSKKAESTTQGEATSILSRNVARDTAAASQQNLEGSNDSRFADGQNTFGDDDSLTASAEKNIAGNGDDKAKGLLIQERLFDASNPNTAEIQNNEDIAPAVDKSQFNSGQAQNSDLVSQNRSNGIRTNNVAQASEGAPATTQATDIVSRIVQHAKVMLRDGASHIKINLKPESLGAIQLRATIKDSAVTAFISAESAAVKDFLEKNVHLLQKALTDQGLKVERLEIRGAETFLSNFSSTDPNASHRENSNPNAPARLEYLGSDPKPQVSESSYPSLEPSSDGHINLMA